jgi:CRP-like cAMP-binding protein
MRRQRFLKDSNDSRCKTVNRTAGPRANNLRSKIRFIVRLLVVRLVEIVTSSSLAGGTRGTERVEMTASELALDAKESRFRPPGQTSTSDVLDNSTSRIQRLHARPDLLRQPSIQSLVHHLGATVGTVTTTVAPSPSHHVTPIITTTTGTTTSNEPMLPPHTSTQEPEPMNKSANHNAIVRHFHVRRVLDDIHQYMAEEDGDLEDADDGAVDPSSPYAQRMVKAATIHEFRRAKSRRDSTMASVVNLIPVVSRRRFQRRLRRLQRRSRSLVDAIATPFTPTGTFSKLRGLVLLGTMLVQLFLIPFVPVYFPRGTPALDGLQIFVDVVYIADFLANCNTAYYGKTEQLEWSRRKIVLRYIKSGWPFWLDLVSSVPIDTIVWFALRGDAQIPQWRLAGYVMTSEIHSIIRFASWAAFLHSIWFLRVVRATKAFWFRVVYSRLSYALAVVQVVLWLLYIAHYVACFWRLTVQSSSMDLVDTVEQLSSWQLYANDLYYAAQLLHGQGATARNVRESIFGSVAVLFGCLAIAFVISCVSLLLMNAQSNGSQYQRKLEMVFATMDKMQLPAQLRRRIHQYYNHLWFEHDSIDGDIARLSHELSRSLGLEVRLFKYMDVVLSVPYWRNSSADFVTQIMLSLDVRAYLPEDYIVRQGEVGDGLFLINRGLCELTSCPAERFANTADGVLPRKRTTVKSAAQSSASVAPMGDSGDVNVRRLMAGHSFGELALLMNYRRTADVRAVSYVEMCVLDRKCFQKLLIRYREDRRDVLRELVLSCMEKSGMRFIAFPWEEMVDRILLLPPHPSKARSHTQLTPWEAADLIVDFITPARIADETVTFGFHDFDSLSRFQLTPITMADGVEESSASVQNDQPFQSSSDSPSPSSCNCRARMEKVVEWQQQTLDRLAALESVVGDLVHELRQKRKESQDY